MLELPTEQKDVCVGRCIWIFRNLELGILKLRSHGHWKKIKEATLTGYQRLPLTSFDSHRQAMKWFWGGFFLPHFIDEATKNQ